MGKRFVDSRWIRQRMDQKDQRINREIRQRAEREKVLICRCVNHPEPHPLEPACGFQRVEEE